MTLEFVAALAIVGAVIVAVSAWGVWLSRGSSDNGPDWALGVLTRWRPMPWLLGGLGVVLALVAQPPWTGLALAYIGVVTGWLMWRTRRTLESVKDRYGFD